MTNPEYVLMLKNKIRPQIAELITRFNKVNAGHDDRPALSLAFKLDIPSDFSPGDNIVKVITQDQKSGKYMYFADVIVTIDRDGGTSNIGIDVRRVLERYDREKINEPMPSKNKSIIGKDKAAELIGVIFETAKQLQSIGGDKFPRGTTTTPGLSSIASTAYRSQHYQTQPQSYSSNRNFGTQAYQYNSDIPIISKHDNTQPKQTSLIKVDTAMDSDLNFKEFIKGAPKWYRSILSESSKQKVRAYIYEVYKRTAEADDVIWQMITGEFIRKGLLTPYCQLFPERKKFVIGEDGSVRCDWTTCPYRTESGYCNHIRLRYGVNAN